MIVAYMLLYVVGGFLTVTIRRAYQSEAPVTSAP